MVILQKFKARQPTENVFYNLFSAIDARKEGNIIN
jgi:hypothetical protein